MLSLRPTDLGFPPMLLKIDLTSSAALLVRDHLLWKPWVSRSVSFSVNAWPPIHGYHGPSTHTFPVKLRETQ